MALGFHAASLFARLGYIYLYNKNPFLYYYCYYLFPAVALGFHAASLFAHVFPVPRRIYDGSVCVCMCV